MPAYTTTLSMPLVGLRAERVLAEVRGALADDPRVEFVELELPPEGMPESGEHATVSVRFLAPDEESAQAAVPGWHDRSLKRVLAAAPVPRGWMSSYGPPELATDEPGITGR